MADEHDGASAPADEHDGAAAPADGAGEVVQQNTAVSSAASPVQDGAAQQPMVRSEALNKSTTNTLEDALFGEDDDDEEEVVRSLSRSNGRATTTNAADEDEDDEDEGIHRQVRRARNRADFGSTSPPPADVLLRETPALLPSSSAPVDDVSELSSRSGSPAYGREHSQQMDEATRRQLEYKEDEDDMQADDNIEVAHLALPQLPVRRTKEHWLARIPHFLRYVTTPFDPETWDEEVEEEALREQGFNSGFSHDVGAASLLRTSNTIRWRLTDKLDQDGARVPESNARIVRWSDGTMSLQVGSELFDITQQTERGRVSAANTGANTPQPSTASQGAGVLSSQLMSDATQSTQSMPMGSSGSWSRPAQSLSYLVVPHQREAVMESEGPIAGSLAFTPADTRSETHRRIAKALRFQKTARVVATTAGEGALDPEVEKARIEKELKDAEKRRIRERQKADRKSGKYDDDLFDIESRRRSRYVGGRKVGAGPRTDYYSDESEGAGAGKRAPQRYDDDDGFIVDDEGDEPERGTLRAKKRPLPDAMQVDDEPDEMELAEQRIEAAERARKAAAAPPADKPRRPEPTFSSDDDQDRTPANTPPPKDDAVVRKKRIIESDDE